MKYRVIFVCLGNICRSPAAEVIFRAMTENKGCAAGFEIDSAGTYGGHEGEKADPRMRAAACLRGYNISHRARQFLSGDFDKFDLIVVMDDSNYERVTRLAPSVEAVKKVARMADFLVASRQRWDHIPDPYYEGVEGFNVVLDLLEEGCDGIFLHALKC